MRDLSGLVGLFPGGPEVAFYDATDITGDFDRVVAVWPDGAHLKFDVRSDHVDWKDLNTEAQRGLYGELCAVLPGFFAELGLNYMQMTPANDNARVRLLRRGEWLPQDDGSFRWAVR